MGRKAVKAAFILLLISALAGTLFTSFSAANPYGGTIYFAGEVPPKPDTIPPKITIFSPENTAYNNKTFVFAFNVSAPTGPNVYEYPYVAQVYYIPSWNQKKVYVLDNTPTIAQYSSAFFVEHFPEFSASLRLTELPEGTLKITVFAEYLGTYRTYSLPNTYIDSHFYISASSVASFVIDTAPPTVTVHSPQNKEYTSAGFPLDFAVSEPTSRLVYSLDGQENETATGNMTLAGLSAGAHNITVYAWDGAGNVGASETAPFSVDVPEPFPTTLVAVSVAVIVAVVCFGLAIYFVKFKKKAAKS